MTPKYRTRQRWRESFVRTYLERDLPQLGINFPALTLRHTQAQRDESYFWALHSGAELDLLLVRNGKRLGFEVKLTRSPKVTPSMRAAQQALTLDHLYVICHAPDQSAPWPLSQGITALPLQALKTVDWQSDAGSI